jgi:glucan phosphoethanolaminetransferase (alkaline phosphatase superfamily)
MGANELVVLALGVVVVVILIAAFVVVKIPMHPDFEVTKLRFAAATFSGILLLIVFVSVLFFANATGPGKDIFSAIVPAVTPIAGAIIGYLFGSKK